MISNRYKQSALPETLKNALLGHLYALHEEWLAPRALACGKGCSACCTQSVTMTRMEGKRIIDYLRQHNRIADVTEVLAARPAAKTRPPLTTNEFAEYCLRGIEPEEPVHEQWDFSPCPFLHKGLCTIYEARPFGCRAFVSTVNCGETGSAEMTPLLITVNTVFNQLIEHIDHGSAWGKMLDVLAAIQISQISPDGSPSGNNEKAGFAPLRDAKPIPGLLVSKKEKKPVEAILDTFFSRVINGEKIGSLLGYETGALL